MSVAAASRRSSDPDTAPARALTGPDGSVIVAGAGIGGLASALALARRGIPSHVCERRDAFAEEGAGIQLGPNGTRILELLGVAGALGPMTAAPEALQVMDGVTGGKLARLPLGAWIRSRHGAPYWTAHRADLHAALLQRVRAEPLIRLSLGAGIAAVDEVEGGIEARLASGATVRGAALVAADGIRSTLRGPAFTPDSPGFSGKSAARAVIPGTMLPAGLARDRVHIWLRPNAHVVHYPVRGGAEVAIIVVLEDMKPSEDWGAPVLPGWLHQFTSEYPPLLAELMIKPEWWRKWALPALPPVPRWVSGRVALLGDAAHPTFPFLAQGAVLALEDSMVLARCLATQGSDIRQALLRYETERRPRARAVVAEAERNGRIYHLDGLMARARNAVLATVPSDMLMKRYDWVYGWKCE
jgi:salicylate hydroxylase